MDIKEKNALIKHLSSIVLNAKLIKQGKSVASLSGESRLDKITRLSLQCLSILNYDEDEK